MKLELYDDFYGECLKSVRKRVLLLSFYTIPGSIEGGFFDRLSVGWRLELGCRPQDCVLYIFGILFQVNGTIPRKIN